MNNTRDYMNSIDTHNSNRRDQHDHFPLSDLRHRVFQDAYEYKRNKIYASRISTWRDIFFNMLAGTELATTFLD